MPKTENRNLMDDFYSIAKLIERFRSTPVRMSDGTVVNAAGLHLLETVVANPNANMSELSALLGVTKGATSQMAIKLQGAGLVDKKSVAGRDIRLFLTKKGKRIYNKQMKLRQDFNDKMMEKLGNYSEQDIDKAHQIMQTVSEQLAQTTKDLQK